MDIKKVKKEMKKKLTEPERDFALMICVLSDKHDLEFLETLEATVNALDFITATFLAYMDEDKAVSDMLKQAEEVLRDA